MSTVGPNHGEIQELLGAYALDAVDAGESDAIELHLRDCPRCRAEVEEHREVAAMLAHTGTSAPSGVWDRIVASLDGADEAPAMRLSVTPFGPDAERRQADVAAPGNVRSLDQRRSVTANRWLISAVSAAAVLVVVLGISLYRQNDKLTNIEQSMNQANLSEVAEDAHRDPSAQKVELRSPEGDLSAQVALHADGHGFLRASTLPDLPPDRTYQLWARNRNDEFISLGVFAGGDDAVAIHADPEVSLLAITEEPVGGVIAPQSEPRLSAVVD